MTEPETVDHLSPEATGRWRVVTQGSSHVWDFDAHTYTREQRDGLNPMEFDGVPLMLDPRLVHTWPSVGGLFRLIVPITDDGKLVQAKFRQSSLITEIRREEAA